VKREVYLIPERDVNRKFFIEEVLPMQATMRFKGAAGEQKRNLSRPMRMSERKGTRGLRKDETASAWQWHARLWAA